MKHKITVLLTFYLLSNSALLGQDIDRMNKSELKEQIGILKAEKIKIVHDFRLEEARNKTKTDKIYSLKILKDQYKGENSRLKGENSRLNDTILNLKDSISSVQSSSNVVSTPSTFNSNDFLNKYYFDQIPLPNNSFSLVLSKLVYGNKRNDDNYYDEDHGAVSRLPEILDANAFTYWGVRPNVLLTSGTNFNNYVNSKNSDYLNSKLPKLEILKNKLFTFIYNDGSEESFLFNVKQIKSGDNNNQRKILQIELANEEVKEDGYNNTAKDIVWRFFAIENECYLALTLGQLNRLRLKLKPVDSGIEVFRAGRRLFSNHFDDYYQETTTGDGLYLSRNKDIYMEKSTYLNPRAITYLFKLQ